MKTSVYIATSLDGFIARENGALDWLPGSSGSGGESEDYGYQTFMDTVDVSVMGRLTYEMVRMSGPWPYGEKRVIVLSTILEHLDDDLPKTVELRNAAPAELYNELKEAGIQHLYVDGGRTIRRFLDAGLIDELTITRVPILIGRGIPLFGELQNDVLLEHQKTLAFHNGLVQSRYKVLSRSLI